MEELKIILETLYSNCKNENEVFTTQVKLIKEIKNLKDKRIKELKKRGVKYGFYKTFIK